MYSKMPWVRFISSNYVFSDHIHMIDGHFYYFSFIRLVFNAMRVLIAICQLNTSKPSRKKSNNKLYINIETRFHSYI